MELTKDQQHSLIHDAVAVCNCELPHLGHYDGDRQAFYCRDCENVIGNLPEAFIYTFKEAL